MQVFWRERRRGQRLILTDGDPDHEEEVGGVRESGDGYDAFAKTFGYEPGRAQKGFATLDEAKAFVESFKPWNLYEGAEDVVAVDPEVMPAVE